MTSSCSLVLKRFSPAEEICLVSDGALRGQCSRHQFGVFPGDVFQGLRGNGPRLGLCK